VVVLLGGVAAAAWWASAPRAPRVVAMRQITTDGVEKNPPVTDGARLYFRIAHLRAGGDEGAALGQVAASGGDTVQLATKSPALLDIDPGGSELLVARSPGTGDAALGVMPVLGGIERPVGDIRVNNIGEYGRCAVWTPDKSHIVYAKGNELRLVSSDGDDSHSLLTAPGIPFAPRVSPDGERLRYSVHDAKTGASSLWEAGADGANPHPLLQGWTGAHDPCCGSWTHDGSYYVFEADGNIWAEPESRGLFRRRATGPVQLTFGPLLFWGVMPSRDGKSLFAVGDQRKGRLARYDPKSKQFVEYLGGLSAEGVAVSPDGAWIAYTAYPEGTLWRSRLDGSERVQLTFPPMPALLPRWSPDGSRIAFFAGTSFGSNRVYTVAATGGTPRRATTGTTTEADPSWSPDGRHLAFGSMSGGQAGTRPDTTIQLLDLGTGQVTPLPGSKGFFSPRWSPDGRFILGLSLDSSRMVIFDVASQKWSDLAPPGAFYGWPTWSSDSTAVTFLRSTASEMGRITIADRHIETFTNLTSLHRVSGFLGPWLGSTPDGWPIVLLDAGSHDIYALDWDAP
jgi:Tol biopolymer transport system component